MRILASPAFNNVKANPYNWLLYKNCPGHEIMEYSHAKAFRGDFDVIHYHWPDGYVNVGSIPKMLQRMAVLASAVVSAKLREKKIVWTVHNLDPHDPLHPRFLKPFMDWFMSRCDGLIFLSETSKAQFLKKYPGCAKPMVVIPHGHYRDVYPPVLDREQARVRLGLPADRKILLFLGGIKPYKNVETLIGEFLKLDDPSLHLVIAGSADAAMADRLRALAAGQNAVSLFLKFIPDDDLPLFFGAADLVVLPFRSILNSGSVILALSFDRPVLAPELGSISEVAAVVGPPWVSTYRGDFDGQVLKDALPHLRDTGGAPDLSPLNWDAIGRQLRDFYSSL